jgi:tetratricopeptide (TPR) repeat protein
VAVLKPMMASSQPSIPLRRAYGAALNYLGYAQLSSDREELAVRTLEEARSVYRSIDGLKLDDAPAAAAFTEASAWQLAALQQLGMNDETRRVGAEAAKVADAVLERRPGHMGAIRARGLIFDSVAGAEMDDLHLQKAVTLLENSAHDWDAIVRIDPSNQIAWNNLSNARATMGYALYRMGRISDALEHYRAAVAIERRVKMSAFLARTFSFPAGGVAYVEADRGERKAAEAALADNTRLTELAGRGLPPDSFGPFILREFAQQTFGYAIPLAAGDFKAVRSMAQAAIERIERRKTEDASQELNRVRLLLATAVILADASYRLNDYAAAERAIKLAIDTRQLVPTRTMQDQRDAADEQMLAAMIAARQDRLADAQRIIDPVLKFHQQLYVRGNDDLTQHIQYAKALYVAALAGAPQRASQLSEAAAIIDRLPPAMRQLISTSRLRNWLVEEQSRPRT